MKSKKTLLITLTVIIISSLSLKGQSNDTEAAIYNIGFGAVFSTVGAIINKKPNELIGEVIKKSLWQGALGGYISFESKRILREAQHQEKWEYFWVAKLVNSAGTSIKENASMNKDLWVKWHINIGFNRIEFNTIDEFSVIYKVMPASLVYTTDAFFRYDFNLQNSLRTGEFIFNTQIINDKENIDIGASTYPGYIVFENKFKNDIKLVSHEIIHQYQNNDFTIFNTYYQKSLIKWSDKNKTINWLNRYIYPEFHYFILRPTYLIEENTANTYYDNFYEHEAGYYSNTIH